ncbi:MAG: response regulator transcription factor [Methylococcaceae bacterium]|nr:response regulator transcription factor [Methylococcaceae bacterium]
MVFVDSSPEIQSVMDAFGACVRVFRPAPPDCHRAIGENRMFYVNAAPHILVVDGDPSIAMLIEHVLKSRGFRTTLLVDGLVAREYVERHTAVDVVLLDVAVPFVAGYELLEQIRRSGGGWGDIPVILMSTKASEHEVVRGFNAGADDFVFKPFRIEELVARIRRTVKNVLPNSHVANRLLRLRTGRRARQITGEPALFAGTEVD